MSGSSTGSSDSGSGCARPGFVVDDRERLTPVPLPGEQPVPQLVLDAGLTDAVGDQPRGDGLLGRLHAQPVQVVGVDHLAVAVVRGL